MALVNMTTLVARAQRGGYAVGAFNVANMEMVLGVVRAAEEARAPVILQVAEKRLASSPLAIIGPLMFAAAQMASVPVGLHFDHGLTRTAIAQALELGFTSVMLDASRLPLAENIARTREICRMAEPYGAAVEGEVGQVGGWESGGVSADAQYADPGEAARYVDETGVQALAVGIGNIHGAYGQQPALRFDVLQTIRQRIAVPLVLHGGSGLTEDDFHRAITLGMCKINVGTALFDAAAGARPRNGGSIFSMSLDMADRVRVVALGHIERFGSQGKAGFAR